MESWVEFLEMHSARRSKEKEVEGIYTKIGKLQNVKSELSKLIVTTPWTSAYHYRRRKSFARQRLFTRDLEQHWTLLSTMYGLIRPSKDTPKQGTTQYLHDQNTR
jgi:hypothetical protein